MKSQNNKGKQFDDLNDALDYIVGKGYDNEFHLKEDIIAHSSKEETFEKDEIFIAGFLQYKDGDGSDNMSTIYALETETGIRGYIVGEADDPNGVAVEEFTKKLKVVQDNKLYKTHGINSR